MSMILTWLALLAIAWLFVYGCHEDNNRMR